MQDSTNLQGFDDLEELLEDDSRTVTAQVVDDLEDLDTLLNESVAIADAKKAKNQGRKLSAEQTELLGINEAAREALAWEPQSAIAHFIVTTCACGAEHRRFSSWYHFLQHRRNADQRKLVAAECHSDLPAEEYTSQASSLYCTECLSTAGLPRSELAIAFSLGEAHECECEQLELTFTDLPSDTLLEELEEILDDVE